MIRRRAAFSGAFGSGLVLARSGAIPAQTPAFPPAIHCLLVGINDYRTRPLRGCLNDVDLLARSLRPGAASIVTLTDRAATRAGFDRAWADVAGRCGHGDMLLFSFSGHGCRRPELVPGLEADGLDEFLVFTPFHLREAPEEILLDNELNLMLAALGQRGVGAMFAADCCNAGTLTRGVDPSAKAGRAVRTLTGAYPTEDLLKALSATPPLPEPPLAALDQVHFFAAGMDGEEVPEIVHQGRAHGALSVGLASGLLGAVSADAEGRVAVGGLADHVLRTVRALADTRQTPRVESGRRAPAALMLRTPSKAVPHDAGSAVERRVRLLVEGPEPSSFSALLDRLPDVVRSVAGESEVDLIWRPATRETVSALGDVLSTEVDAAALSASVERVRALRRLRTLVAVRALELRLDVLHPTYVTHAAAAHPAGTRLKLTVATQEPELVLFNIAGEGTIQPLFPKPYEAVRRDAGTAFVLDDILVQSHTFGSDHLVGVAAMVSLAPLVAALRQLGGKRAPCEAVEAVEAAVGGRTSEVGLIGLFTRPA